MPYETPSALACFGVRVGEGRGIVFENRKSGLKHKEKPSVLKKNTFEMFWKRDQTLLKQMNCLRGNQGRKSWEETCHLFSSSTRMLYNEL